MNIFPDIPRRARDAYHNLQDDDIMKNIFNSGRNKNKIVMRIPTWMITDEMKFTKHYKMYAEVFGLDVPLTQSQRLEKEREETTKDTEVEPDKETPMVDVTNIVPPVNVDDEEDEISDEVFELRRRVKGKNVEETRISPIPSPTRSPMNLSTLGRYGYLFAHLKKRFMPRTSSDQLADNLHDVMMETLPCGEKESNEQVRWKFFTHAQISSHIQNAIDNAIPSLVDASVRNYMSGHILHVHSAQIQSSSVPEQQHQLYLAMKADPLLQQQDIAIWLALQMKFEKTQVPQTACRSSAVRTRDQDDPHDDAHPEGENSAKRQKTSEYEAYVSGESSSGQVNIEEPGPSTSGRDEHQYHIDQMKNFLQSDIVWESRKEILVSPHPRKITPLVKSCQRDPKAPTLSLINQDLLYLKKGNSGPEKIVLSLRKFLAIVFNDDDFEETVFTVDIVARKANDCIVSITDPDYKNLNKNDIEDMYLQIVNNKVPDYANTGLLWSLSMFIRSSVIWERVHDFQLGIESYQQKINLTVPTITFPGIKEYDVFSIVYEPVHGLIYTNSKKEKGVMRHLEIHKFCDATLRRTLEGLKSYYNDVKYGYVQKELTNDEVEFLKLFGEEIEVRLNYRDQMRRWEMYVNGRPLGPRRERPE
ncbi:hypothetical protein Tco_0754882 [Tanacetum coccineum]